MPNDIALLGTDNEDHLCENSSPTLSSIELDFAGAGRRCVEIVAERIAHGGGEPVRETFGPLRIVRRTSTRRSARLDRSVVAAMDLIRARAVTNLRVPSLSAGVDPRNDPRAAPVFTPDPTDHPWGTTNYTPAGDGFFFLRSRSR